MGLCQDVPMPDANPATSASEAAGSDARMEGWMVRVCYGWQLVGFVLVGDRLVVWDGRRLGWLVVGNLFLAAWNDACEFVNFIFLCDALRLYFHLYGRKDGFFESMDGLLWLHGSMVNIELQ